MSSLRSWLRGPQASQPAPTAAADGSETPPAEREKSDMEDAMAAAAMIMNDDIDGAEARLRARKDPSAFHQLGLGLSTFMRAMLGLEKEIMAEAASQLLECENRAWADMKKAQKDATAGGWFGRRSSKAGLTSQIYPPGSEFALVHAEAQLMGAIVSVLQESVTDALKGFYKLRKAFITLSTILEAEAQALKKRQTQLGRQPGERDADDAARLLAFSDDMMPGSFDAAEFADLEKSAAEAEREAGADPVQTPDVPAVEVALGDLQLGEGEAERPPPGPNPQTPTAPPSGSETATVRAPLSPPKFDDADHSPELFTEPVDVFVHSGANLCFGILMLVISMAPPSFSRLLYIIGFKGDRERGLRMLWRSTKFANINGGMAGLMLLAYYNSLRTFNDILPAAADIAELAGPDETVGVPMERCRQLLATMSARFPESRLWQNEEARTLANDRRLDEAVAALLASAPGKMKQVTALSKFELSTNAMHAMDWRLMHDSFLHCVELSDWSHSLYYYLACCAEIEMYRDDFHVVRNEARHTDMDRIQELMPAVSVALGHKEAAVEYLQKAKAAAGRKRAMGRPMPLEVFALRKIARWEERAAVLNIHLIDAVGVSPAQEMVYLWNGSNRMQPAQLENAMACLGWDRCTADERCVDTMKASPDESAIKALCEVALLRSLGRLDDAKKTLAEGVMNHDR